MLKQFCVCEVLYFKTTLQISKAFYVCFVVSFKKNGLSVCNFYDISLQCQAS